MEKLLHDGYNYSTMTSGVSLSGIRSWTPTWQAPSKVNFFVGLLWTGAVATGVWLAYKVMWAPRLHLLHQTKHNLTLLQCKILLKEAENTPQKKETLDKCKKLILTLPSSAAADAVLLPLAKQYLDLDRPDEVLVDHIASYSTCKQLIEYLNSRNLPPINALLNRAYKVLCANLDKTPALANIEEFLKFAQASEKYSVDFSDAHGKAVAERFTLVNKVDQVQAYWLFMNYYHDRKESHKVQEMTEEAKNAWQAIRDPSDKMRASIYLAVAYFLVGDEKAKDFEITKLLNQTKSTTTITAENLILLGKLRKLTPFAFPFCVDRFKFCQPTTANQAEVLLQVAQAHIEAGLSDEVPHYLTEALNATYALPFTLENCKLLLKIIRGHRDYFSIRDTDVIATNLDPFYFKLPPQDRIPLGIEVLQMRNSKQEYDKAKTFLTHLLEDLKTVEDPQEQINQLLSISDSQDLPHEQNLMILKEAGNLLPKLKNPTATGIKLAEACLKSDLEKSRKMSETCTNYVKRDCRFFYIEMIAGVISAIITTAIVRFSRQIK
jgi:hypothetical protein